MAAITQSMTEKEQASMAAITGSMTEEELISIPEFFQGKTVFITGVTGFMGKVLLEKLLRSCPDVGRCYVLVRPKKGLQPEERIRQILDCKLFEKVKTDQPGVEHKVVPVCGDILEPHFGMSEEDQQRVCEETSVVFHSAATVKFDEELKLSVQMNVVGVQHLSSICRRMTKLQSLIHVSTAYANCDRQQVAEQVYEPPMHPRKLIDAVQWMDKDTIDALTTKLIGSRPNTYTYTKAMAESLLLEEAKGLPVAIVRPSIVGASWLEPLPGWVDNLNGPTGLLVAIGKGLLRCMHGNFHATADLIPVDIATNAMIAAAWYTGVEKPSTTLVYNCTTGQMNRFTWGEVERMSHEFFIKNPCNTIARVPNPHFTLSNVWKTCSMAFDHLLPAYLMDAYLRLVGRRPMFVRIQDKLWKAVNTLEYFTCNQWNFRNDNIFMLLNRLSSEDRKTFPFDPRSINWSEYMENYCLGAKRFILKEEISELPKARLQLQRLQRLQTVLKIVALAAAWRLLVKRVPVAHSLWNLLLGWVLWIFQKLPMLARSS
ncbi:fatty acyl-CoA reductase 1-like [Babylonia areolata]|uniref:fatty acyl-CoA reductase 1-like n=1 Tax=Babylonia areolata TaxID=304850 RepID=UPI003FCFFA73